MRASLHCAEAVVGEHRAVPETAADTNTRQDTNKDTSKTTGCRRRAAEGDGATLAAHGATPHQLMAIFGRRTLNEAERYKRAVDQQRMAGAMTKLVRK